MDVSEEVRAAHKRELLAFLENDVGRMYVDNIKTMINHKRRRLIVDISDLFFFRDLAPRILRNPGEYMQAFSDAVTDLVLRIDGKYLKEGETVLVGFKGPFVSHCVTPRELLSEFIGSMVCVEGIVTKCSLVRSKVVKCVHFCPSTEKLTTREYRDITSNMGLPTGSVYPTKDENGNLLVTEYGLCQYKDHQTLSMQEMPEYSAPGQLPQTVDVIVQDDLVDSCKPGDRVAIVGIYKAFPGKSKGGVNAVFRTVLIANNVSLLNKEANASIHTPQDLRNIKNIAERDDAFDLLGKSLASSSKRRPKPRRVGCSFITNDSAREVTFSKRHQGLFRKAIELSIPCGAEIAVIAYSPHGNPFVFAHPFTPDALIYRYLSDGATVAAEAAAHGKQFEDAATKLQVAKRETEKIAAEASRKRSRWWEQAVRDDMEEDELEYYIASLERLTSLVSDRVSHFSDSGFYSQLLATDMKISMDMDAMFLDELQYS